MHAFQEIVAIFKSVVTLAGIVTVGAILFAPRWAGADLTRIRQSF
jgi:hypothetical protein